MKIIFTGGGTGGHFYPIVAVIDAINDTAREKKLIEPKMIYMSGAPYDKEILLRRGVKFKKIRAGKIRRYFSLWNVIDIPKTIIGVAKALFSVYLNFPDVIFSKGGYNSFPVVLAARIFGIPLIIHESDSVPGRVNQWSGKFARRIAVSFSRSARYFPEGKIALTGNPVRKEFFASLQTSARKFLQLKEELPVIFFMGGSQGAAPLNDILIDILPEMLKKFQIVHQCGKNNIDEVRKRVSIVLEKCPNKDRYRSFDYLNTNAMRMAYGAADIIVSRAGSGSIFEIAASGLPSIIVPLPHAAQDHQKENAYAFAEEGAAQIIEQANLTPHILLSESEKILSDKNKMESMGRAAKNFARPDAAEKIAKEIISLALEHAR